MITEQFYKCLYLYIGCDTNKGKLIGVINNTLFIETKDNQVEKFDFSVVGDHVFLYLRQLGDLSEAQSKELIEKGLSIGRPHGYTFSNFGFVYLLSLSVDLFGLIHVGAARDIRELAPEG